MTVRLSSLALSLVVGTALGVPAALWYADADQPVRLLAILPGLGVAAWLATLPLGGDRRWPTMLWAGVLTGAFAATLAYPAVDFVSNFCIFDCGPPDHAPAVLASTTLLLGSVAVHAAVGALVRPAPVASPLPPRPEPPE